MNLNDLRPAWRQYKLMNAMDPLDAGEILTLIDGVENGQETKMRRVVLALIMFITITFIFQGDAVIHYLGY
ncbi:MAG: hypothetical protein AAFQ98_09140 [Bacteroidota bacterium]